MRFILAGTTLILRTPGLWRFIVQPLLAGAVAFVLIAAGSYWLIVPRLSHFLSQPFGRSGVGGGAATAIASVLFLLLLVLVSGSLFLIIVSFFSSSLWEKLSMEVELKATGRRVETKLPTSSIVSDSLLRGMVAVGIGLLSLCCGWVAFGIPAILLAGFMGLYDYTSAAYLRRGILFTAQSSHLRNLPARYTFAIGAGLLTLLPVVNVLMLPCLVAGGTLMVIEGERQPSGQPEHP